jgi:hypothetical protein
MKPWVYLVIGIGLFGGGIYSFLSTRDFIGEAATTGGVVIDLERERDADGNDSYYPRVQFETNGRSYQFRGQVGSGRGTFKVGEQVEVLYDPADPYHARINSFLQLWFFPLFLGGMGVVFTAIGAAVASGAGQGANAKPEGEPATALRSLEPAPETTSAMRSSVVDRSGRD